MLHENVLTPSVTNVFVASEAPVNTADSGKEKLLSVSDRVRTFAGVAGRSTPTSNKHNQDNWERLLSRRGPIKADDNESGGEISKGLLTITFSLSSFTCTTLN